MRSAEPLRFGRMYFRQISGDGVNFGLPFGGDYTLAFSRVLYAQEVLVAYNVSANPRNDCIIIDATLRQDGDTLNFLYGATGSVTARTAGNGTRFVQLNLAPHQFVILR
jgi:alpha-amylase